MSRSTWLPRVAAPLLATASATVLAAPAQAATVGVAAVTQTTKVQFNAAAGKQNRVVVTRSGNTVTIDDLVPIKAGAGCRAVAGDSTVVRCTPAKAPTQVVVYTYDGNDTILNQTNVPLYASGGAGNDTLGGGTSGDWLGGDAGADALYGGAGNDSIWGHEGDDLLSGGDGADRLEGWLGSNRVYGGNGDDYIAVWTGVNRIWGDAGKDTIFGSHGVDIIYGGDGADQLFGQGGNDVIGGDADNDYIRGGEGNDGLYGAAGDDLIWGDPGDDLVSGAAGDDRLAGDHGVDKVYGGDGSDNINPTNSLEAEPNQGAGADYYSGGAGHDKVDYYQYWTTAVTADADGVTGDDGATGEGDTIAADVETLIGGSMNDRLTGTAKADHLIGGPGDDTLIGNGGEDSLNGYEGDDTLDGGDDGAADWLDGGEHVTAPSGDTCFRWNLDTTQNCESIVQP